jgi:phosphate transport system substrate-binding protein
MSKLFNAQFVLLVLLLLASSCARQKPNDNTESTTGKGKVYKGNLNISVDESLQTIMQQQAEVFQFLYDSVHLNVTYAPQPELLQRFRNEEASVLIMARELTDLEKNALKRQDTIYTLEMRVAYDAIAMVAHPSFDHSQLDLAYLQSLFASKQNSQTKLVFEGSKSSSVEHVLNTLGYKETVSPNIYALKSADEVVSYVEQNKDVIGFIPYSFLSDTDDKRVQQILKRIKILSLRTLNEGKEVRVSANQSDIANGTYPLIRTVNTVTRYTHSDNLERLFVNFLYKEKGARIFLKAGLIPVKMPEREINVNTEGIKSE